MVAPSSALMAPAGSIPPGLIGFFPRTASDTRATHAPVSNMVISGSMPVLPMTVTVLALRGSHSTVGGAGLPAWFMVPPP